MNPTNIPSDLLAFVIVLGPLIFFHEAGHFIFAKLFGVRVLVFSFGFGKRLTGFTRGGTDYRLSLIPLGGYVRMAGDTPEEGSGKPDEFLSRPKWQRFVILVAGPLMNVLIAIGVIAAMNMVWTEIYVLPAVLGEVQPGKAAAAAGLRIGDRIVAMDGETINDFEDMRLIISTHAGSPLRVDYVRNGQPQTTTLVPRREESELGPVGRAGIAPEFHAYVGRVAPGSPAALAGLKTGDRIVAANGKSVSQLSEFDAVFRAAKGKPLPIDVERDGKTFATVLPAASADETSYRGFMPPAVVHQLGFTAAIRDSVDQNVKLLRFTLITIGRLIRGETSVKDQFSGPLRIAAISGAMLRRSWFDLVGLIAMVSLQLGLMNLLPIPVLDGGHIAILMIEGVARRDLSLAVKERIQQVGFALLAALMIVVIYNDFIATVLTKKG